MASKLVGLRAVQGHKMAGGNSSFTSGFLRAELDDHPLVFRRDTLLAT